MGRKANTTHPCILCMAHHEGNIQHGAWMALRPVASPAHAVVPLRGERAGLLVGHVGEGDGVVEAVVAPGVMLWCHSGAMGHGSATIIVGDSL